MPKRTNPFQRLIFLIEHHLARDARVTESAELIDRRTNSLREVDILIETKVGEHSFSVGIECVAYKRPADVSWVERMSAKHQDLPTNKLILVSESGFSKNAKEKAAKLNIETMTLDEAQAVDWSVLINEVSYPSLAYIAIYPTKSTVILRNSARVALGPSSKTYDADGSIVGDVRTMVQQVIGMEPPFIEEVIEEASNHGEIKFLMSAEMNSLYFVKDIMGELHEIIELEIEATAKLAEEIPIDFSYSSWGETYLAYGEFIGKSTKGHIVISRGQDQDYEASLSIQTNDGTSHEIHRGSSFVNETED